MGSRIGLSLFHMDWKKPLMGSQLLTIIPSGVQSKMLAIKSMNGTDSALVSSHMEPKNAVSGCQFSMIIPIGVHENAVFNHPHTAIAGFSMRFQIASKYGATVDQLPMSKPAANAIPRTINPTGLIPTTAFIRPSAAVVPAVATRNTPKPTAAPNSPLINHGLASASVETLLMIGPTVAMKSLNGGSNTVPTVMAKAVMRFCNNCRAFSVVSDRALYSPSIEPAYFVLSPTALKFFCSTSRLVSKGAIAPTDSLPNRLVSTAACLALSTLATDWSTLLMVPSESVCMPRAISLASRRKALNAICCDLVAALPAVRVRAKFFMPVAATS